MNTSFLNRFGIITLLLVFWITPSLMAQQQSVPADTSLVYELGEVIISASKYRQDPQSVGRNVTVITQEDLQKSVHSNVSELLSEQQSFHIIGGGQTPGSLQQGFLRNSNSNHSVIMIDGVRISDPSTNDNTVDLSELSLAGVERVEIVRGAHSTLYGSSAIGGVVNIITERKGEPGFNTTVETQHGRFDEGGYSMENRLYSNYTTKSGVYANVGINQRYSTGMDATIDTLSGGSAFNPQDRDGFRKLDLTGKVGYKSDSYDVYASYRREGQRSDADKGAYRDDDNAYTDFNRDLFTLGAEMSPLQNVSLEYNGAYSELQRDFIDDSSQVSADGTYDGIYVEANGEGSLLENELKGIWQNEHINFVMGASASRQTMSMRNYTYSRSDFGVYESTTDLDSLGLQEVIYSGYTHADISGAILSEQIERFSLVTGARFLRHDEFGSHFTYEINPKVRLSEGSLIYGSVATGFNAPSLYQLYSPEEQPGSYTARGNRTLNPENSRSFELGWKQQLRSGLSLEFSAFNTRVQDVIEYVYLWDGSVNREDLTDMHYLGDTYLNASKQHIKGLELALTADLLPGLSLSGNMSVTKSTLQFSEGDIDGDYTGGNYIQIYESGQFVSGKHEAEGLTRRPRFNSFLSATYQATDAVRLKIDNRYVGSRNDIYYSENLGPGFYGALDRSRVDGYNITDFSANYVLSRRLSLTAKMENIFNTDYVEVNGYNTRGRSFYLKARFTL